MNILYLAKHSRLGASSRYRSFQYIPFLKKAGIEVKIESFFDEEYLKFLYSGKKIKKIYLLGRLFRRLSFIFRKLEYDLVFIEKEIIPYFPAILERHLKKNKIKYILDYDDAVFVNYRHRSFLKNKIPKIMSWAKGITAGSHYIIEYARDYNSNVMFLPTVINTNNYFVRKNKRNEETVKIGWIGTPSTSGYLKDFIGVFKEIQKRFKVEFIFIGAGDNFFLPEIKMKNIAWRKETEIDSINSFDIGIMPLPETNFAQGKCGLKIIQYMGCGLPVIASAVGENNYIIEHEKTGFLAESEDDWIKFLSLLIQNRELRRNMGQHGRIKVEKEYDIKKWAGKLIEFMKECAG
jgi:glycosyltransferase involved in cell wall biosynthesis